MFKYKPKCKAVRSQRSFSFIQSNFSLFINKRTISRCPFSDALNKKIKINKWLKFSNINPNVQLFDHFEHNYLYTVYLPFFLVLKYFSHKHLIGILGRF